MGARRRERRYGQGHEAAEAMVRTSALTLSHGRFSLAVT